MEKLIRIGTQERIFRANGATPIKYRKLFKGADFFRDLNKMKDIDLENMSDADFEGIERLIFAMCEDSNKPDMTFEDWLAQFELFALLQAIPQIIGVMTDNLQTQSITESKNTDRAES